MLRLHQTVRNRKERIQWKNGFTVSVRKQSEKPLLSDQDPYDTGPREFWWLVWLTFVLNWSLAFCLLPSKHYAWKLHVHWLVVLRKFECRTDGLI